MGKNSKQNKRMHELKLKYQDIVINEPIDSKIHIGIRIIAAAAALVGYAAYYKTLFDSGSTMRVWEDTYGRSLFFFFSSVLYFLYCGHYNENISFFELES